MASASLQIKIESASNLYKSVGPVAGKCNPYVIVEVPGQESMKLQTEIINNEPNPLWNFTGEIDGFMDRDVPTHIVSG
jgi:Ca2+-dependent lipid-binding protein